MSSTEIKLFEDESSSAFTQRRVIFFTIKDTLRILHRWSGLRFEFFCQSGCIVGVASMPSFN
jgi:hypothetical protein